MKIKEEEIFLFWFNGHTGKEFRIGRLTKSEKFKFEYMATVRDAIADGFLLLPSFDSIGKKYECDIMFPTFSTRLPNKRRPDIEEILHKYSMSEYDEFELLKRSGAELPIDDLRFAP